MSRSTEKDLDVQDLEDEFDIDEFRADTAVQEALSKGTDLRQYALEVESALRSVERDSIQDYICESESLAGLHTQIRQCDTVLDSMESMLRGFQGDLSSISAQIKYLQDESLAMNVKLRNRKAAEAELSSFIQQIVVTPDLISNICDADVNETYLAYVLELNKKVTFSKQESTKMTSACMDMAPELEKLRTKSVQKIREFLLERVGMLRKKMTNIQILQQSVLLKYKGLYHFLLEHAPETALEVKEVYTTTMSAIYLVKVKGYLAELSRARTEPATKSDLLGAEEWNAAGPSLSTASVSSFFGGLSSALGTGGPKPATARGDQAYKLGERINILEQVRDPPLIPAVLQQGGVPGSSSSGEGGIFYEAVFRSYSMLLIDMARSEHSFMLEFFGDADAFEQIFGKGLFHCMEHLEHYLISTWDAIACVLVLELMPRLTETLSATQLPLLSNFFHQGQALVWSRFKQIMEAHVASLATVAPKAPPEVHPHYIARRYAELPADDL